MSAHTADELIGFVKDALKRAQDQIRALSSDDRKSYTNWTRMIRNELAIKGRRESYHAYPDRTDGFARSEWLYDVCWIDYGGQMSASVSTGQRRLKSVAMVAECEWLSGDSDFLDDFEKLLQARTKLRVMIFGGKDKSVLENRCEFARDVINKYENAMGDTYLLVWMPDDSAESFESEIFRT